jgi:hypothetical protein
VRSTLAVLTAALGAALASAGTAGATTFYLSTLGGNTLAGHSFRGGDVVQYDDAAPASATTVLNEDLFGSPGVGPEVDAFEFLPNGHYLISTTAPDSIAGVSFVNGDIVDYDPVNNIATVIFDEQLNFAGQADIDAVAMLPNGNILFSTTTDENGLTGGPNILDGDVIEWNIVTNTYVGLFVSELILFGGADANIDAFDVLPDGRWALSTAADATIAGLSFTDSDLVLYDPVAGTAIVWIPESVFVNPSGSPLDAIAVVPEPNTLGLLALGIVGLAVGGRRR